jgi:hypothetical protein
MSRPDPPLIPFPNANEPVPPNFLRSQSALLGTAGLVARIKPSQLGVPRGSSSSHPIVVDDIDTLSNQSRTRSKSEAQPRKVYPEVSDSLLSVPSQQEVVNVLVAQKDIFPVLEGILKLSAEDSQTFSDHQQSGFQRRMAPSDVTNNPPKNSSSQPAAKRRKLNHVPAGAADWDVPFPFEEGYGPDSYKRNWKRERAKQLAAELMSLIKDAVKIAATKAYWRQYRTLAQPSSPKVTVQLLHIHSTHSLSV